MKRVKYFGLMTLAAVLFASASCSKDDHYTSRLRELIIDEFLFDASADSQTQTFRKENLSNYVASSDQDWCVAKISNSGLTVFVTANETYEDRTATVTLKDKVDSTSRSVKVSQFAKRAVVVSQTAYEVAASGGEVSITVKHNTDFTIKMPNADWITSSKPARTRGLDSTVVRLVVAKNNSGAVRSATLAVIYTATGEANKISINQAFAPVFTLNTTTLTCDENGGELQVLVKANFPLDVTFDQEWLSDGNDPIGGTRAWEADEGWQGATRSDDADSDDEEELYYWQKVKVKPFTEKKGSRTGTVSFTNLAYDIYKQVTVTQNRPIFIQAVTIPLTEGDTYSVPIVNKESAAVVWQSDNTEVATVDATGKVTAKGAGSATIKVTSSDGAHTDTVTVTVEAAAFTPEFSLNTTALTIDEHGGELKVLVKANVGYDVTYDASWLTDGGSTDDDGLYSYQKIKVAPFTEKTANRTSTVTFTNLAYDIYKQVTVTQNRPLFIQAVTTTLTEGNTYAVPLHNASSLVVTWKSSNPEVATVDAAGTVTAKGAGTAVITVASSDGTHSDTMTVNVEEGEFKPEFTVNAEELSIDEKGGVLKVLVKSNMPVSVSFSDSWIADAGTAKVNDLYFWQNIKVGAFSQKSGSRSATVAFSNLTYDIYKQVTITQRRPLFIQAVSATLKVGGTYTVPLYNPDNLAVSWQSSDTAVATVDAAGTVTAKGSGTAIVKVTSIDGSHSDTITVTVEAEADKEEKDETETVEEEE